MSFWKTAPPVFFIGMPRSGTTVLFEAFARHDALAWLSNYADSYPHMPGLNFFRRFQENRFWRIEARKGEFGKTMPFNRFFFQPNEAYRFWNAVTGIDFAGEFLSGREASAREAHKVLDACRAIVRFQGKERFSAKLTGPPRITFLNSVFSNAYFIHVVRDGRAVVRSLLKVPFWKDGNGYTDPFWKGGLTSTEVEEWKNDGASPEILAAMQWRRVIRETRKESRQLNDGRFLEVRYEDYIEDPLGVMETISSFVGLSDLSQVKRYLEKAPKLVNMNHQFRSMWDEAVIQRLSAEMAPYLGEYGYSDVCYESE